MRIRTLLLALAVLLAAAPPQAFAFISENPRQGVAPISATFGPDLAQRESGSHLGFPLRFLEILVRNGFSYTDPFGFQSVERGADGKYYIIYNGQKAPLTTPEEIEMAENAIRVQNKQAARYDLSRDESQFLFVSWELAKLWLTQKFIAYAQGKCFSLPAPNVPVYRVEGAPNTRILISENGLVTVQGDQTLFLNFGSGARAQEFFTKRMTQGMPGVQLKSFEVNASFLEDLRSSAVPESMARQFPDAPILVDVTKAANQFGLRGDQINSLLQAIIQGTGRIR